LMRKRPHTGSLMNSEVCCVLARHSRGITAASKGHRQCQRNRSASPGADRETLQPG
jgi:hypothetical protein